MIRIARLVCLTSACSPTTSRLRRSVAADAGRYAYSRAKVMLKIQGLFLLLTIAVAQSAFAADSPKDAPSFQKYFAEMRRCLSSSKIETCLPPNLNVHLTFEYQNDYHDSNKDFVRLVKSDKQFRDLVSSCFERNSKIVMEWYGYRLVRSSKYACSVSLVDNEWKLESFYNFFSNE